MDRWLEQTPNAPHAEPLDPRWTRRGPTRNRLEDQKPYMNSQSASKSRAPNGREGGNLVCAQHLGAKRTSSLGPLPSHEGFEAQFSWADQGRYSYMQASPSHQSELAYREPILADRRAVETLPIGMRSPTPGNPFRAPVNVD
ncbi:hypothetical protein N7462_008117 [Penicillium macrosclerotiorum]|uniref:uncharacterized protein n=1 Tax=Penicillium macrosclerotiorum TaxID=303699 RepID=UPI00254915CC|nr:uncharacterized protein N7462_008117 [Penicillium macrosclerotiorum]KAJ5679873.1 hypothetical protein N7462_008117 [Penicillium macrosclerotiorum]